jgi:hypothetical protein
VFAGTRRIREIIVREEMRGNVVSTTVVQVEEIKQPLNK